MKIQILTVALLVLLVMGAVAKDSRPNILVLISDDQNMDSIGAYGSKYATPHIDRLAAEGILHTRAYSTATLCVPTRYSLLLDWIISEPKYEFYIRALNEAAFDT